MPVQNPSRRPSGGPSEAVPATDGPQRSRTRDLQQTPAPRGDARQARVPVVRSRTGALWVGIAVAVAVLVLLIVFMLQNTAPVEVAFFGLRGTAPLSLTLLIAGVGFAVVTLVVGSLRIGQLRHRIGADSDRARRSTRSRR